MREEKSSVTSFSTVSAGIKKLFGPMGGIEKWGWRLLSVLLFETSSVQHVNASGALLLESEQGDTTITTFPEITLKSVAMRSAQVALERMFRHLGSAGGEDCLFAVEWFLNVGRSARDSRAVASLWCACRLLEGIAGVALNPADVFSINRRRIRKAEKFARSLTRSIAELWDEEPSQSQPFSKGPPEEDSLDVHPTTEHIKGLIVLDPSLCIGGLHRTQPSTNRTSSALHLSMYLQLLSISAGILQSRFPPLLIHALYPILHSIVSTDSFLSTSGLAALGFITSSTSYASPANLLLSNFDYALDSVSRRLTRQRLDVDAAKVLILLIQLVGSDVVQKAGDLVEECFDRLDEYHGYDILAEGLIEVLEEVVKVVESDKDNYVSREPDPVVDSLDNIGDDERMKSLAEWFSSRHFPPKGEEDESDYGPAPRKAWGATTTHSDQEEESRVQKEPDPNSEPSLSPAQALVKQIVARSLYFLTHSSPLIRARILRLLSLSTPVLPESALLPAIHHAWPFVLNRLADPEPFVVTAAAALIESLSAHIGSFMFRRIWDDIWPRFRSMLGKLDAADAQNALARRGAGGVGTESAYTHSHRLYRSILRTMTMAAKHVRAQDSSTWEVIWGFRRFLHYQAHNELQACARELYEAIGARNEDAVWLALFSTMGTVDKSMAFMKEERWDIQQNVHHIVSQQFG